MFGRSRERKEIERIEQDIRGARSALSDWRARFQREGPPAVLRSSAGVGRTAVLLAERFGIPPTQVLAARGLEPQVMHNACIDLTEALKTSRRMLQGSSSDVARQFAEEQCAGIALVFALFRLRVIAAVASSPHRAEATALADNYASFLSLLSEVAIGAEPPESAIETADGAGRGRIERALRSIGRPLPAEPDDTQFCISATREIVTAIMERAGTTPRTAEDDSRFVAGIFTFVASDYISRTVGAQFEMVSSVAVIGLFFDLRNAREGGALVNEVANAYNKLALQDGGQTLQAIGQNIAGWINEPSDARLSRLADLFAVCRENVA
ncbi:MAG: hypothetical protein K8F58_03610 [Bauldia sp.]|nr:hypothetical protein [Bauldia sp.]